MVKGEILDFSLKTRVDSLQRTKQTEWLVMEYLYAKKEIDKKYISEAIAEVTNRRSQDVARILDGVKAMNIL